jgi:hypothetical protein
MIEKIETWFQPVHEFIIDSSDSVVFWIAILFIGLTFYAVAYTYFAKD